MSGVYCSSYFVAVIAKEVVKQLPGEASTGTVLSHKQVWQTKADGAQEVDATQLLTLSFKIFC